MQLIFLLVDNQFFSGDSLSVEFNHKIPRIQHSFLLTIESSWCQQNYELEFQSPYINSDLLSYCQELLKRNICIILYQYHILYTIEQLDCILYLLYSVVI